MSRWPSRRFQFVTIILLFAGTAATIWLPPLSREKRAEQLYVDAWFAHSPESQFGESGSQGGPKAVAKLRKAVALAPRNARYQQALVMMYPPNTLPLLISDRKLDKSAIILGESRLCLRDMQRLNPAMTTPGTTAPPSASTAAPGKSGVHQVADMCTQVLDRLYRLRRLDPGNALNIYRTAMVGSQEGMSQAVLDDIRRANTLRTIELPVPEVSASVRDSLWTRYQEDMLTEYIMFRLLARDMTDEAGKRLRSGDVASARSILENCCDMGVNLAASRPRSYLSMLAGGAVFSMGWKGLEPLYKDFGPTDRLEACRHNLRTFDRLRDEAQVQPDFAQRQIRYAAVPATILTGGAVSLLALVLSFALWLPAWIARRRHGEMQPGSALWPEGWLARTLLAVHLPVFTVVTLAAVTGTFPVPNGGEWRAMMYALILLPTAVTVCLALRALHRGHDGETGIRTGMLRFLFRSSASAKAWTRKYITAVIAAQILFFVCIGMLTIILYKPITGAHPWQVERFQVLQISHEAETVIKLSSQLQRIAHTQ